MHHEEKSTCSCPRSLEQGCKEGRIQAGKRSTSSTTGESTGAALAEKDIVRFWSKVDKNGPLPDQTNPHYAGLDRCWVWTASKYKKGYGTIWWNGKPRTTHRLSWEIANGPIPEGEGYHGYCVLHICDRENCCNPTHLKLGSHLENMIDRDNKGRNNPLSGDDHYARLQPERLARGERHGSRTKPECVPRGDRNGTRTKPESRPRGTKHSMAKINEELVVRIREIYAAGGINQEALGAMFGLSQSNISAIVCHKLWAHVPPSTPDWI